MDPDAFLTCQKMVYFLPKPFYKHSNKVHSFCIQLYTNHLGTSNKYAWGKFSKSDRSKPLKCTSFTFLWICLQQPRPVWWRISEGSFFPQVAISDGSLALYVLVRAICLQFLVPEVRLMNLKNTTGRRGLGILSRKILSDLVLWRVVLVTSAKDKLHVAKNILWSISKGVLSERYCPYRGCLDDGFLVESVAVTVWTLPEYV